MAQKRPAKFMDNWLVKGVKSDKSNSNELQSINRDVQSESAPVSSAVEQNCADTLPAVPQETGSSISTLLTELQDGCFQPQDVSDLPIPVQVVCGKKGVKNGHSIRLGSNDSHGYIIRSTQTLFSAAYVRRPQHCP